MEAACSTQVIEKSAMPDKTTTAKQAKISATRFPLVHKLSTLADFRRWHKGMREALAASNRQAGAYEGWGKRWQKRLAAAECEKQMLEIEMQ